MSEQFENKMHDLLHDVELEPNKTVWHNVEREINKEKKRRIFFFWWLLPLIFAGTFTIYKLKENNSPSSPNKNQVAQTRIPGKNEHFEKKENVVNDEKTPDDDADANNYNVDRGIGSEKRKYPAVKHPNKKEINNKNRDKIDIDEIANKHVIVKEPGGNTNSDIIDVSQATRSSDNKNALEKKVDFKKDTVKPGESAPIIKVPTREKLWRFGVLTEVGLAGKTSAITTSPNLAYASASNPPTTTSSSGSVLYIRENVVPGITLGIGVSAERRLNKKFKLNLALKYQYQSFADKYSQDKDSAGQIFSLYRSATFYNTHSIDASIGLSYKLIRSNHICYGIGFNVDNMYLLAGRKYFTELNSINAAQNKSEASFSLSSYNKWQPYLNTSLYIELTTKQREVIQLSPYIRYGLRPFDIQKDDKHLMSLGIRLNYFFK